MYPLLSSSVKIGYRQVGNRIAYAPTGKVDADSFGNPTDQTICGYLAIARGGVGWVIVEHTLVTYKYGKGWPRMPAFYDDEQLAGWAHLAQAIKSAGVTATVQLSLGFGRYSLRQFTIERVSPSTVAAEVPYDSAVPQLKQWEGRKWPAPRELTIAEVEELEDLFVASAKRVKNAGFHGVELHGAHGYLIGQFLSPLANRRSDKYGGDMERRLTLPRNLIEKTRKALGNNFIIGMRISADEHVVGGYTLAEAQAFVPKLVDAGLDCVHISSGSMSAFKWFMPKKEGELLAESAAIKQVCSVPVICPNIHTPELGEEAIHSGKADLISSSRGLIADPNWPRKALDGRSNEIVKCIFCYKCITKPGMFCPVNPKAGWEHFYPEYWPRPEARRGAQAEVADD